MNYVFVPGFAEGLAAHLAEQAELKRRWSRPRPATTMTHYRWDESGPPPRSPLADLTSAELLSIAVGAPMWPSYWGPLR